MKKTKFYLGGQLYQRLLLGVEVEVLSLFELRCILPERHKVLIAHIREGLGDKGLQQGLCMHAWWERLPREDLERLSKWPGE